jgi:threonine/homoserine/homoserine lactone efflux protein
MLLLLAGFVLSLLGSLPPGLISLSVSQTAIQRGVEGWWQEGLFSTLIFSFGVTLGTIFALGLYAWLGQLIVNRSMDVARYANHVIGLIFIGLGIKILFGLYC